MNATPGNDPSALMKASDADRDAVLSDLSEHFQAGRLTADEFEDRTGRALAARTWAELRDLLHDLPTGPAGPRVPVTAATGTPPQRPPRRTVLVPIAVLAGIGLAVAMSAGTGHARWGILWLLLPVLLITRRMTCRAGAPRRSGPRP
jgi:ferric-dicitrate binding protein FerR (iron transport regulator)